MTDPLPEYFDKARDVPYIGGILEAALAAPEEYAHKLNTILELLESDCRPPWLVYIETLLPALGEAVLVLLGTDWDDIARGWLRPAGIRSRKRFRHGRKGKVRLPEIPETGELIGKRLPGAKILRSRRVMAGERYLWVVDGVIQRALWYWLLVDLVVETAYQWATNILESAYCRCPESAGFDVGSGQQSWGAHADWRNLALNAGDRGEFPLEWKLSYAELEKYGGTLMFGALVRPFLPTTTVQLTIGISSAPNQPPDIDSATVWVTPDTPPTDIVLAAKNLTPGRYWVTYATPGSGSIIMQEPELHGRVTCPDRPRPKPATP